MKYQITWKQLNKKDGSKTYAILVGLLLTATILLYLANDYQFLKSIQ